MKQKDIFIIVVSSFIVIVIWIAANLWHIQNASKLSASVILQSKPITPVFDTQTLEKLKERSQVTPLFTIKNASATASTSPTPVILPSPTPTENITPIISPTTTPVLEL
jgi:hypothetical protein